MAVFLTPVQTKETRINIHKRNNNKTQYKQDKHSKYKYTYYQNCHTIVKTPSHTHPHTTKQVKTATVQDTLYLLTPWCRVLLEKLTGLQLVKKFPAFHGIRRFINSLTSVRQLSLSWASPIQFIYPHPTSWKSVLILSTHLRLGLPSGLIPSGLYKIRAK